MKEGANMKREIPKTNNYADISVLDFPYRKFHDDEFKLLNKLVRKMIHEETNVPYIAVLFSLLNISIHM